MDHSLLGVGKCVAAVSHRRRVGSTALGRRRCVIGARCSLLTAPGRQRNSGAPSVRVVIVGGGVGGLATAGRLAAAGGYDVTILEKNAQVGGRLQSTVIDGCRFDTGPSLLLFKDKYYEAFEAMGSSLDDFTTLRRVEPAAYRVFFGEDSSHLDLLYDIQEMFQQLEGVERGAGQHYLAFLSESRAALDLGVKNFIERDFSGPADLLDLPKLLPLLKQVSIQELLGKHVDRMARRFKSLKLQAMFTFQDLYVGLSPYDAPGVFSLLAATELTDGVWYPQGGFQTVRDGLASAATQNGVKIHLNVQVTQVCEEDGRVACVKSADGQLWPADVVVSNVDVPSSYGLLDSEYGRGREAALSGLDYSAGVIAFNWVLDRRYDQLLHHNIFLSDKYEESWQRAKSAKGLLQKPNFYVHAPSRSDPSAAEDGKDSVMVLLPVANMAERGGNADYAELVARGRQAVLSTLDSHGLCGVERSIVKEMVIDPPEWQHRYGVKHGAAFGLSHGLSQLAALRPPVSDAKLSGLYFTGASCRPGNGVPLVLIGSKLTAEAIHRDVASGALSNVTGK